MAEFCIHEKHGGICEKTDTYCNLGACPAEDLKEYVTVRRGRWLCVDTDTEQFFLCNRCKKKEYWESRYCPNCGAKMGGECDE